MPHGNTRSAPRVVATCAAISLATISAACAAIYGWSLGLNHSIPLAALLAAAAFAAESMKPLAVVAMVEALRNWRVLSALLFAMLVIVLFAYSVTAELSLSATTRGDAAAQRKVAADDHGRWERRHARLEAQLAALPLARSGDILQPMIQKELATPGARCDADPASRAYGEISRRICPTVRALEAEAARFAHRARLEQELAATAAKLEGGTGSRQADPLGASLVGYASALGYVVKSETLQPWLALVPVLLLELGSALGLLLAQSLPDEQPKRSGVQPVSSPANTDPSDDDAAPPTERARDRVLQLLHEQGGRVHSGQRGLAALIGASASRVNQVLNELAAEGIVRLTPDRRRGTLVELVPLTA